MLAAHGVGSRRGGHGGDCGTNDVVAGVAMGLMHAGLVVTVLAGYRSIVRKLDPLSWAYELMINWM